MFKYYYRIIRHFFELKCLNKKWLVHLAVSAILRISVSLVIPFVAALIIDNLETGNYENAYFSLALFFLSAVTFLLCRRYNYWAYYKASNDIHNCLQRHILEKVTEFDPSFTADISKSELIATAFRDIDQASQIPDYFIDFVSNILSTVIAVAILCFVDWRIGIVAGLFLLTTLGSFIRHTKLRDRYLVSQHEHDDEITGLYSQIIDGYKEVQTLNLKAKLQENLELEKKIWNKYYKKQRFHRDFAIGFVPIVLGSGRILLYLFSAGLILSGEYNVSLLILVLGYYEDIISSFDKISETIDEISYSSVAVERLRRLLNYKTPHMDEFGENETDQIAGLVEFKNVSFKYEEPPKFAPDGSKLKTPLKKAPSLKRVSFHAQPGEITALVGKSGSGKSTIFRLLLRLYKINRGEILLDDTNIYDFTKKAYAGNVSIVTQKPFIFDMTIRENLNLVDENRSHQEKVCKFVGIHEDIMKLKKGYDTKLVADGSNLSLGERQLLSLARTLLSGSEVLLFDEVSASLDSTSTARIIKILQELKKHHTVIVITHKPEIMNLADHVVVIDNGEVAAEGIPSELLKNSPAYQALQQ